MTKKIVDWINKPIPSCLEGKEIPIGIALGIIIGLLILWWLLR